MKELKACVYECISFFAKLTMFDEDFICDWICEVIDKKYKFDAKSRKTSTKTQLEILEDNGLLPQAYIAIIDLIDLEICKIHK